MPRHIVQFSVVVRDYDEALSFYVDKLGLERLEDTDLGGGSSEEWSCSKSSRSMERG
jgi:catechol 2,3-dioxygenase-like lactoylglutathione lyase family enzyme